MTFKVKNHFLLLLLICSVLMPLSSTHAFDWKNPIGSLWTSITNAFSTTTLAATTAIVAATASYLYYKNKYDKTKSPIESQLQKIKEKRNSYLDCQNNEEAWRE